MSGITRMIGTGKAWAYKNRGILAFGGGTILTMIGTGLFIKETVKFSKRLDAHKEEMDKVNEIPDPVEGEEQTEEVVDKKALKKDICKTTVKEAVKRYTVPTLVTVAGYGLQTYGFTSVKSDLSIVSMALNASVAAYEGIKQKIIEKEGVEKWNEYAYDDAFETVADISGDNEEITEEKIKTGEFNDIFAEFFEESNPHFKKYPGANKNFIMLVEQWANDELERNGYLMYHDVLKELGMKDPIYLRKETRMAGWKYDKNKVHQVDFGLRIDDPATKRFMDETETAVLLRFNCVANVYNYI